MQKNPRGGTELQLEYLKKYVDPKLLDQVQITTSVPEKIPLHPTKVNILWQKNSYDQPNLAPWFSDPENHKKYDWYVFNSNWNYEKFRMAFKIPTEKCVIIKNGIDTIEPRKLDIDKNKKIKLIHHSTPWRGLSVLLGAMQLVKNKNIQLDVYSSCAVYGEDFKNQKIKLIHHSTPWRGLSVLLGAMQLVKNKNIQLDVYSSCAVYGEDFKNQNDKYYQGLYDQAKQLPNVSYIGYKPNEYIKENLKNYDVYVYPSIWEETFCISALEAMAAGLYCVVTNYGALFETCAEFPMYIPYSDNHRSLAAKFAQGIEMGAEAIKTDTIADHLKFQIDYVNRFYDWKKQGVSWSRFLKGAIEHAKQ